MTFDLTLNIKTMQNQTAIKDITGTKAETEYGLYINQMLLQTGLLLSVPQLLIFPFDASL